MDSLILLAAIAGVPVLVALVFRVSAVFLFLSLAAGSLLVTYVGDDASLALGTLVRGQNTNLIAQFGLLLLPVALTLLLLRKTMPRSRLLLHVPVLVVTGLALAALALPFLDAAAQEKIFANEYGNMLRESQDVAVGAAAILALLLMWLTGRHKEDKKHKKHH
jgi:hypothetical protein